MPPVFGRIRMKMHGSLWILQVFLAALVSACATGEQRLLDEGFQPVSTQDLMTMFDQNKVIGYL